MTPKLRGSWIWPILLLAFGLRIFGANALQLTGDESWSVYLALKDLPDLTWATAVDSHPPLYYYLLHFWIIAVGVGELANRFLSTFTGILTIAVTYKLGRRLSGYSGGTVAALLAAISPFLVYFDRIPRMYSLLTLLATVSIYLVVRLMEKPSRLHICIYAATSLAAVYTHYYGLLVVAVGFLTVAFSWRHRKKRLALWAATHVALLIMFLPWLLYAIGPSVASTTSEYQGIGLPRPPNLLAFIERFWVALNVGNKWKVDESSALTVAISLVWVVGLLAVFDHWRSFRRVAERQTTLVLVALVSLPLAANIVVFLVSPYVPFTRLLILAVPTYLLLLSWVLGIVSRSSRFLSTLLTGLAVGVFAYALVGTLYVQSGKADMEALETADRIGTSGRPRDAVLFQAIWHAGYYLGHSAGPKSNARTLEEIPVRELPKLLEKHPRVWLSMYNSAKREALNPQEEWLDRNAYKASESWRGRLRLSLYGGKPDPSLKPVNANLGNLISLEAAGIGPSEIRQGDILRLLLRWRALEDPKQKYVTFVHLIDRNKRGCTGRDSEPVDGLRPTETWRAGETIDDRRGLLIGAGVPPGEYYLSVGMYPRDDWRQRLPIAGSNDGTLQLGPVEVLPQSPMPFQDKPIAVIPEVGVELLKYRTEPKWESQTVMNVDGPVAVWSQAKPQPGGRVSVTLDWRASRAMAQAHKLRLEITDSSGQVWGQSSEALLGDHCPTFRWIQGEVVSQSSQLQIRPDAPPGKYSLRAKFLTQEGATLVAPVVFGSFRIFSN